MAVVPSDFSPWNYFSGNDVYDGGNQTSQTLNALVDSWFTNIGDHSWVLNGTGVPAGYAATTAHLQFNLSLIGTAIPMSIGWARLPGQVIFIGQDRISASLQQTIYTVGFTGLDGAPPTNVGQYYPDELYLWLALQQPGLDNVTSPHVSFVHHTERTFTYDLKIGVSLALVFCEPIDPTDAVFIQTMTAQGTTFYDRAEGFTDPVVNVPGLTSSQMQQLRDSIANMVLYQGTEDQLPDPTMERVLGVGNVPAYRGLRYLVLPFFPMAMFPHGGTPDIKVEFRTAYGYQAGDILSRLMAKRSITVDGTQVTNAVLGYTQTGQRSGLSVLQSYREPFNYRLKDGTPIVLAMTAVDGSLTINEDITVTDCIRRDPSRPAAIHARVNPSALPREVRLQYQDVSLGYDTNDAPARHDGTSTAGKVKIIPTDFVMDKSIARALSFDILYQLRAAAMSIGFETIATDLEVGDVVQLAAHDAVVTLGSEINANPEFIADASGYTLNDSIWTPGNIHSTYDATAPLYPYFGVSIDLVSGLSYQVEIHQTITGDSTYIYFNQQTFSSTDSTDTDLIITFTADWTGTDTMFLDFWNWNDGATRAVTLVSVKPAVIDVGENVVAVIDEQTFTSGRTNTIVATALLTSIGTAIDGAGATAPTYYDWPYDLVLDLCLVENGRIWTDDLFGSLRAVNTAPFPYPRLPRARVNTSFLEDDGDTFINGTFCMADDATWVYWITQSSQVMRTRKTNIWDWDIIETGPFFTPTQAQVYKGKLYFNGRTNPGGIANITVVDLANFTTSGISYYQLDVFDATTTTVRGLVIDNDIILVVGDNGANSDPPPDRYLYKATVSSMQFSRTKLRAGSLDLGPPVTDPNVFLGRGRVKDGIAYFVPYDYTSNPGSGQGTPLNFTGAMVDMASMAITYFDVRDDTTVTATQRKIAITPTIDGDAFCFIEKSARGKYITRRALGTLAVLPGIELTDYSPNKDDGASYLAFQVEYSDGYYYIPGSADFFIIKKSDLSGQLYPRLQWMPAPNGNFASPQIITLPADIRGNITEATTLETGGLTHMNGTSPSFVVSHIVWFLFTPTTSGDVDFTLKGQSQLGIFTGESLSTLVFLTGTTDQNTPITLYCIAGTRYRIAVGQLGNGVMVGPEGDYELIVTSVTATTLDDDEDFLMLIA